MGVVMTKRLAEQEKAKKAQIILLERFATSFDALTDERAGQMVKGIFHYKITKQEPVFGDDVLTFFWQDIKRWLDESETYYNQKCKTNKDNANARWKKNNSTDNANAYDRIQTDTNYPNATPNATPIPNVQTYPNKGTVNFDSSNKGGSDFEKVLNLYQEKIQTLKSADEVNKLRNLVESYGIKDVVSVIDFMEKNNHKGLGVLAELLDGMVDF
jgi:hypothetical protein